jgi:hypothetical protein
VGFPLDIISGKTWSEKLNPEDNFRSKWASIRGIIFVENGEINKSNSEKDAKFIVNGEQIATLIFTFIAKKLVEIISSMHLFLLVRSNNCNQT